MDTRVMDAGTAREDLCRFLAACYYEPGPEFVEEKLFDSMREAAGRVDPGLAASAGRLGQAFAALDLESLLVDYTRLFLGPVGAPARPYGALWLGGNQALMQDSTMDVQRLYAEGGFELAEDFREAPDHIAAELEVLYLLLFRERCARRDGEASALAEVGRLRRRLLSEHIGRWTGPFTRAMHAGARTAYYRELADLTARFVDLEVRRAAPR
jgi:TorA maturation chaperone TorD